MPALLSIFREASAAGQPFIFTFAQETTVRSSLIDLLVQLVEAVNGRVFFAELTCSELLTRALPQSRFRW